MCVRKADDGVGKTPFAKVYEVQRLKEIAFNGLFYAVKTCDNLVAKPHTSLSCTNGQRYGSICTIKPELGYKLRGPSVVECTDAGAPDTSLADCMFDVFLTISCHSGLARCILE